MLFGNSIALEFYLHSVSVIFGQWFDARVHSSKSPTLHCVSETSFEEELCTIYKFVHALIILEQAISSKIYSVTLFNYGNMYCNCSQMLPDPSLVSFEVSLSRRLQFTRLFLRVHKIKPWQAIRIVVITVITSSKSITNEKRLT